MNTDNKLNSNKINKILFVCLGNICRSPAAEGIFRHLAEVRGVSHLLTIDSAGIGSWHVGQLPDHRMRKHGMRHGYDLGHHARQLTGADFSRFDLLVGMDAENLRDMSLRAPDAESKKKIVSISQYMRHHKGRSSVPDPYYGGDRDFELAIELLEDACEGLLEYIMTENK